MNLICIPDAIAAHENKFDIIRICFRILIQELYFFYIRFTRYRLILFVTLILELEVANRPTNINTALRNLAPIFNRFYSKDSWTAITFNDLPARVFYTFEFERVFGLVINR